MPTWNQPVCLKCYRQQHPGQQPICMAPTHTQDEVCCDCGLPTSEGVYVRRDPAEVQFPKRSEE